MSSSRLKRLQRAEALAHERWRAAWSAFYGLYLEALPDRAVDLYAEGTLGERLVGPTAADEAFLQGVYEAAGWDRGADAAWEAWDAALVAVLPRLAADDLTVWPERLPRPPDETPGVFDRLCSLLDEVAEVPPAGGVVAEHLAVAAQVGLLGYACAVRTFYGVALPKPPRTPGVIRLPGSKVRIQIVRSEHETPQGSDYAPYGP